MERKTTFNLLSIHLIETKETTKKKKVTQHQKDQNKYTQSYTYKHDEKNE